MEKIDSHQHFWRYSPERHDWIDDEMKEIRRHFLPADIEPLLKANGFTGCVAVQADQTMEETMFLIDLARQHRFICGVVGWVDLMRPNLEDELDILQEYDLLKGVRHILQSEPDDALMLKPAFKRGISILAGYNLTYDILVFPRHLKYVDEFVSMFPDQPFVIDHLAKPYIKSGDIQGWKKDMEIISKFPNLMCKISGMVTEADWKNWKQKDFTPFLDVALESFGAGRLMFGSDWPVCLVAAEYPEVVDITANYLKALSGAEQSAIFGGNAKAFYKLI
ncbi:MAG: amidohydrolase family protein [Gemmatimonadaceae bacterium]|nr:amidohydrolase family protein [Chitinophagaceae bacterium]